MWIFEFLAFSTYSPNSVTNFYQLLKLLCSVDHIDYFSLAITFSVEWFNVIVKIMWLRWSIKWKIWQLLKKKTWIDTLQTNHSLIRCSIRCKNAWILIGNVYLNSFFFSTTTKLERQFKNSKKSPKFISSFENHWHQHHRMYGFPALIMYPATENRWRSKIKNKQKKKK